MSDSVRPALSLELRPKLAPKTKLRLDQKTGKYILLYPEKGLLLNPTGAAILKLCTGEQTLFRIIAALTLEFQSDQAKVQAEVLAFVQTLLDRGLIQVEP
ncbi:MAG: pyrroloquinoline quinone biosynthesis peptide chaperone PqqD [Polyangiaceae bacterium]